MTSPRGRSPASPRPAGAASVPRADPGLLHRLRLACEAGGYSHEGLAQLLEPSRGWAGERALQARRLAGTDRLSTIARLFWLGDPVERAAAARALDPATVDELAASGLLRPHGDTVSAPFQIVPYEGLLLASDRANSPTAPRDVVAGKSESAETLERVTIRRLVRSALDLGTGGGIQALIAARHAEAVVGADINPRALEFARVNASINGVSNIEWVQGSWLEPIGDRRFDLIVANPPYVVSPDLELVYRDSGHPGDGLVRMLVETLPAALADGGVAHVMCDWVIAGGGAWDESPRQWVAGTGCEAVVIRLATVDPLGYAAGWNAPLLAAGDAAYEQGLDRWLDYHEQLGVERIASGLVVLRKRAGAAPSIRAVDAYGAPTGACGEHVERLLDATGELARLADDRALLAEPLRLVEGARIDQTVRLGDGSFRTRPARVRIEPGLPVEGWIDVDALDVLFECDGTRPLAELVDKAAGSDRDALAATVVAAARELLGLGILTCTRTAS